MTTQGNVALSEENPYRLSSGLRAIKYDPNVPLTSMDSANPFVLSEADETMLNLFGAARKVKTEQDTPEGLSHEVLAEDDGCPASGITRGGDGGKKTSANEARNVLTSVAAALGTGAIVTAIIKQKESDAERSLQEVEDSRHDNSSPEGASAIAPSKRGENVMESAESNSRVDETCVSSQTQQRAVNVEASRRSLVQDHRQMSIDRRDSSNVGPKDPSSAPITMERAVTSDAQAVELSRMRQAIRLSTIDLRDTVKKEDDEGDGKTTSRQASSASPLDASYHVVLGAVATKGATFDQEVRINEFIRGEMKRRQIKNKTLTLRPLNGNELLNPDMSSMPMFSIYRSRFTLKDDSSICTYGGRPVAILAPTKTLINAIGMDGDFMTSIKEIIRNLGNFEKISYAVMRSKVESAARLIASSTIWSWEKREYFQNLLSKLSCRSMACMLGIWVHETARCFDGGAVYEAFKRGSTSAYHYVDGGLLSRGSFSHDLAETSRRYGEGLGPCHVQREIFLTAGTSGKYQTLVKKDPDLGFKATTYNRPQFRVGEDFLESHISNQTFASYVQAMDERTTVEALSETTFRLMDQFEDPRDYREFVNVFTNSEGYSHYSERAKRTYLTGLTLLLGITEKSELMDLRNVVEFFELADGRTDEKGTFPLYIPASENQNPSRVLARDAYKEI